MTPQEQIDRLSAKLEQLGSRIEALLSLVQRRREVDELNSKQMEIVPALYLEIERLTIAVMDLQRREADRLERETRMNDAIAEALGTLAAFRNVSIN